MGESQGNRWRNWLGVAVFGGLLSLAVIPFLMEGMGITEEDCVAFWNAEANTVKRVAVVEEGFRRASVEALSSAGSYQREHRYESCAFTFAERRGRGRWLTFFGGRDEGASAPIRIGPPSRGLGFESRAPLEALYALDHTVADDGSLIRG